VTAGPNILVVCTANVCRSPVAQRLLARRFEEHGIEATVHSAGTRGGRNKVHEDTVLAARRVDLDVRDHESRLLTPDLIRTDGADLVIGMTREHLREIVAMEPTAWPHAFTLKELARRLMVVPPRGDFAALVSAAGEGRRAADLMVPSPHDDLADPYGGPARGHVDMVAEIRDSTEQIVRRLSQTTSPP